MGVNRRVIISDAARRLLSQQRGVISRAQAVEAGLSDKALSILVRDERWTRTQNGIYMRGASVPTFPYPTDSCETPELIGTWLGRGQENRIP